MTTWRPWYIQKILGIWIFLFSFYELWEIQMIFFTAEILANRWNSMNANDFTSSSFLSHDFRISDHYDIAATPAILICILCFTGNLLYPLSWFQAKGSYYGGICYKVGFSWGKSRVVNGDVDGDLLESGNQPQQIQYDFLPRNALCNNTRWKVLLYLILQYPAVYPFPQIMTHLISGSWR